MDFIFPLAERRQHEGTITIAPSTFTPQFSGICEAEGSLRAESKGAIGCPTVALLGGLVAFDFLAAPS